jgi:flagellar protein FlaJ
MRDFCYAYFRWLGRPLLKAFRGVESNMEAAYMRVHPEVYFSLVGFVTLMAAIASSGALIALAVFIQAPPFLPPSLEAVAIFSAAPLIALLTGAALPRILASNRVSGLKVEIPYASMYISVMASGGLSPYESLLRMRRMDLLPNMRKEVQAIKSRVILSGSDPVTAMEQEARVMNLGEYKELLMGYASTVRSGGASLHYLYNQTDLLFKELSTRIKAMGERMNLLMETYIIISVLGSLGLFLIYIIGLTLPVTGVGLSPDQFFTVSFIALPLTSLVFIYLSDTMQISYPVSNWMPYAPLAASLPVGLFLGAQLILPLFGVEVALLPPLTGLISALRAWLNFPEGCEAAIGLTAALTVVAVPCLAADYYFIGRERRTYEGITRFLRDFVETRKSGLSPERCIEVLSRRDYRAFSRHLQLINLKLGWGYPLRQIYQEFRSKCRNWLSLVNIYLLVDTLDVGGGTEESLETLANFSETMKQLEDEKRATLAPLILVPYIGAPLLSWTAAMFMKFFSTMSGLGVSIPFVTMYRVLLTPLVLNSFTMGLVAGKVSSGRVSAGFLHALILTLVSLAGVWAVFNLPSISIVGG